MIAQTYCGRLREFPLLCNPEDGPCPACLRAHIAKLETRNAELRAKLEALRRTNFAEPFEGWIGLATELLDALEAALERAEGAEAEAEKSAALASRLAGAISRMEVGVLPGSAERCAARWAVSSATDRASYERGWEAREAEGLTAAPEPRP